MPSHTDQAGRPSAAPPRGGVLRRWARRGRALLAALGALVLAVSFTPLVHWWATALAGPWNDPAGEVLVVPGGAMLDESTIGLSSYWRAVYAGLVWRQGHARQVVLLGGGEGRPVAEVMRDFLVAGGVPAEAIILETQSRSTRENALFAAALLREMPGRKVLLTSDYHMYRAVRAFRAAGLEVLPYPYPDVRKRATRPAARWGCFLDLVEESVKIVYYAGRGWI